MNPVRLEDFLKIDFLEGTLVEYKDGYGFNIEFSRGKINKFNVSKTWLDIGTDNEKARLKITLIGDFITINKKDEFYNIIVPVGLYSIAFRGIDIPRKFNYKELVNFNSN
ncbi:MAG: hypothetical protein AABW83_01320 [Nanoarchaeota archaeon]